jgi:GntR family colanic acid and biofilm gene transcriptional regulator
MIAEPDSPEAKTGSAETLGVVERVSTLTDKVYSRLRRGLLVGVWSPGQKVSARQLSRDLGVSLTPVREAMMRLASEGALDISETRTFSIPVLGREQYREIIQIRLALEPMAIEAATLRMTDEHVDDLTALNERLAAMIGEERFNEAHQLDSEFHLSIYGLAEQPVLLNIIDSLWLRAGPTRNLLSHTFRKRLTGYENHRRILTALRARDMGSVRDALIRDLSEGSAAILAVLEE